MAAEGSRHDGAEVRAKLDHPVIDGDAHLVECEFVLLDFLRQVAGPEMALRYEKFLDTAYRPERAVWFAHPSGPRSLDRATIMLPRLYKERLDACGIDYCVVYTSHGIRSMHVRDDEMRQAVHRAFNTMFAELFAGVSDRMTPAALIPTYSPEEAIAELEYAVRELGLKAITINSEVRKPVPEIAERAPDLADFTTRTYPLAVDAEYDYDPFWAKCLELGVSPAAHTKTEGGWGVHSSPSSYVFNHLGSFASGNAYLCKALFLGGVTRRFPQLNFGFLEGGVHWAASLYNTLCEHWEKRNIDAIREQLDPARADMDLICEMFDRYGDERYLRADRLRDAAFVARASRRTDPATWDEFRACEISKVEDVRDLFVPSFYFGCEADDRMVAVAFDERLNHFGAKLKATFGSDIGHWDVEDITQCVAEAHRLVDDGLLSDEDFRDFTFTNNVTFYTDVNPDFFKGTAVEAEVDALLAARASNAGLKTC